MERVAAGLVSWSMGEEEVVSTPSCDQMAPENISAASCTACARECWHGGGFDSRSRYAASGSRSTCAPFEKYEKLDSSAIRAGLERLRKRGRGEE